MSISAEMLVAWFNGRSHEGEHVEDVLGRSADDLAIVDYALNHAAVIVSKDYDFVDMVGGGQTLSLLWIRTGNVRTEALVSRLDADWARIEAALRGGQPVVELR